MLQVHGFTDYAIDFTNQSTMSFSKLPPEIIRHILGFLGIKDHSRFSRTCKDYEAFGITKLACVSGAERAEGRYDDFANRYTMFRGYSNDDDVPGLVVGINAIKYSGTTRYVKELVIRNSCKYIRGDTIQYTPRSLTGEGLRYLVKLDIEQYPYRCTISDVRFERLVTLRASDCKIIRCKFDALENLDLIYTQFLSEMPVTIKTLHVHWCQFSDDCVRGPLVNLVEIDSTAHDFIQYAPNVKKVVFDGGELYSLPESLEYLRLVDVEVYEEKFLLPNLRYLYLRRSKVGCIVAPRLSELTLKYSTISILVGPVLDKCHIRGSAHNISVMGATAMQLEGDCSLNPECFDPNTVSQLILKDWPGNVQSFREVRRLSLTEMEFEQLHLPYVEGLFITMCKIGTLMVENAKEMYLICDCIDRLVLGRTKLYAYLSVIGALEAHSIPTLSASKPTQIYQCGNLYETVEILYTDCVIDRKNFPRLRALYYDCDDVGDCARDMLGDLDALYVKRFTPEMTSYINPRILVVEECGLNLNLSNLSNLKLLMLSKKNVQVIPEDTPIEYFEEIAFDNFDKVCDRLI